VHAYGETERRGNKTDRRGSPKHAVAVRRRSAHQLATAVDEGVAAAVVGGLAYAVLLERGVAVAGEHRPARQAQKVVQAGARLRQLRRGRGVQAAVGERYA
jgi:hypothetical protein